MRQLGRPDLSGRVMEIVGWNEEAGKYELRGTPPPYWTCPLCGEVNKRTREACNVCGGRQEEVAPGATEAPQYQARPEDVVLPAGTEVEIDGLQDFPELNGQPGTVVAFDRQSGRYHVELPDGGIRAIRPPHLASRRTPARGAEFGRWTAPAPEPSHVDEPEPPEEAPCESAEELRRVLEALDGGLRLARDVEAPGGRWRLARGRQLLREGGLRGRAAAELRRPGTLRAPLRLRFARASPWELRAGPAGAYWHAALRLDATLAELLRAEHMRLRMGPGRFSFLGLAAPGWPGPTQAAKGTSVSKAAASAGWGGWVCPECGHINPLSADLCKNCDPECEEDD